MPSEKPDFVQMVIDVFREHAPNARDSIHRGILRLLLRKGWSFENFLGPLVTLEERGWLVLQDETYVVTNAGAQAFGGKTVPTGESEPSPAKAKPPVPPTKPPKGKRREP